MKTLRNVVTIWSISSSILFTGYASAQNLTGINTINPTNTLDVNGNLRIRSIETVSSASATDILLAKGSGVFSKISASDFVKALKIPTNVFNGEQATGTQHAFSGENVLNKVVFDDIKINDGVIGTWDATNNTYTVLKTGIYHIVSGVGVRSPNSSTTFTFYINGGSATHAFSTDLHTQDNATVPNEYALSGTYVKVLVPGDVIYCGIKAKETIVYVQTNGFMHIIYTPL